VRHFCTTQIVRHEPARARTVGGPNGVARFFRANRHRHQQQRNETTTTTGTRQRRQRQLTDDEKRSQASKPRSKATSQQATNTAASYISTRAFQSRSLFSLDKLQYPVVFVHPGTVAVRISLGGFARLLASYCSASTSSFFCSAAPPARAPSACPNIERRRKLCPFPLLSINI